MARFGNPLISLVLAGGLAGTPCANAGLTDAGARVVAKVRPVSADGAYGKLEKVAEFDGPTVTGVAVSREGRIFLSFPRWGDPLKYSVAELRDGRLRAFPEGALQDDSRPPAERLVSIQSVVVDADNRLWILDNGTIDQGEVLAGGAKLIAVDLATNQVIKTIPFPADVATKDTYLNDIRFDLKLGTAGVGFVSDSSAKSGNGIIVVDLATGQSFRRLTGHRSVRPDPEFRMIVEGRPLMEEKVPGERKPFLTGSDGIAVSADGDRFFYAPLSGRRLYSVDAGVLADHRRSEAEVEATVMDLGDKGTSCDGLETDDQDRLYITSPEFDSILRRRPDGQYEGVVHDPRLLWPDSMAISADGYLYFTVNQLERAPRFHGGKDLRKKPWVLFRTPIDAGPSLLAQPRR